MRNPPLACLDANVFLAVLIPESTRASNDVERQAHVYMSLTDDRQHSATMNHESGKGTVAEFWYHQLRLSSFGSLSHLVQALDQPREIAGGPLRVAGRLAGSGDKKSARRVDHVGGSVQ